MPNSPSLLIFVAIHEELKVVKKILKLKSKSGGKANRSLVGEINGYPIEVEMTSMGMEKALKVAQEKIDKNKHRGVFVLGYCGGLSLTLKNSDVIVPNKVISSRVIGGAPFIYEVESDLIEEIGKIIISEGRKYRAVPMITENSVIETPAEKQALFKKTRAEAVDMETSEILRVAQEQNLRACALKVVIDDCETELPHFNEIFKKTGNMDQLSIASALMASPNLSMRLSSNMKQAGLVIESVLPRIVEKLCTRWGIPKR